MPKIPSPQLSLPYSAHDSQTDLTSTGSLSPLTRFGTSTWTMGRGLGLNAKHVVTPALQLIANAYLCHFKFALASLLPSWGHYG